MASDNWIFAVLILSLIALLVCRRSLLDALIEGINNFRGGPPTAMHPSPVNDAILLLRRRIQRESEPQINIDSHR